MLGTLCPEHPCDVGWGFGSPCPSPGTAAGGKSSHSRRKLQSPSSHLSLPSRLTMANPGPQDPQDRLFSDHPACPATSSSFQWGPALHHLTHWPGLQHGWPLPWAGPLQVPTLCHLGVAQNAEGPFVCYMDGPVGRLWPHIICPSVQRVASQAAAEPEPTLGLLQR